MNPGREYLPVGWRPSPSTTAFIWAATLLAAAAAIHSWGIYAGLAPPALAGLGALFNWQQVWLDGSSMGVRSLRTGFATRALRAPAFDHMAYRHVRGPPMLRIRHGRAGCVLEVSGRHADTRAFRQAAMWLIVHGRRRVRIDPALLDALAAADHPRADLPHDTSPA